MNATAYRTVPSCQDVGVMNHIRQHAIAPGMPMPSSMPRLASVRSAIAPTIGISSTSRTEQADTV